MADLVERIDVARNLGMQPRVHPNGFLQLDLTPEKTRRMHVWHDDLPRQEVATPIHDHEFDLQSWVHLGKLMNIGYKVDIPHPDSDGDIYQPHRVVRIPDTEETQLVPDGGPLQIQDIRREEVKPGQMYSLKYNRYHVSQHEGTSLSIMRKQILAVGHAATVLVPEGQQPDNGFVREEHDVDALWDLAYETARAADELGAEFKKPEPPVLR